MNDSSLPPQPPPGLPFTDPALNERDQEHLKILSICYYVMAGLTLLGVMFGAMYVIMGGMMMAGSFPASNASSHDKEALQMMGGTFMAIGLLSLLIALVVAVLEFIVARRIVRRQSRILCLVMAGLNCLSFPHGTALGVFTFIILSRPQVAASFDQPEEEGPAVQ